MTRARIAGVVLLVLLGTGLLTRITDRAGVLPPKKADRMPMEIRADQTLPVTETVDLRKGNRMWKSRSGPLARKPLRRDPATEQSSGCWRS